MKKPPIVRHEPEARRFTANVGGKTAYLTYRELDARILDLEHTFVPREHRGGGMASLRNDPLGKGMAQLVLAMPVRVPRDLP